MLNCIRRFRKSRNTTQVSLHQSIQVLYEHDAVRSFGTISDVKSHKADATLASLTSMFNDVNFGDCNTLYIVIDSPTSQYRNKKVMFLMKKWAVEHNVDVY